VITCNGDSFFSPCLDLDRHPVVQEELRLQLDRRDILRLDSECQEVMVGCRLEVVHHRHRLEMVELWLSRLVGCERLAVNHRCRIALDQVVVLVLYISSKIRLLGSDSAVIEKR